MGQKDIAPVTLSALHVHIYPENSLEYTKTS